MEGFKKICDWATETGNIDRVEALGFIDNGTSIDWIASAGGRVMNLLAKGSLRHVTRQLKKTPEEHIEDIKRNVQLARKQGLSVNIYLEDWSNGMIQSPEYVFQLVDGLKDTEIKRFMLPDTLGVLNPEQTFDFCKQMVEKYPNLCFDFHAHNDYDMAIANVYSAIRAGIGGIHTTVNGLGERAGNAPLASVVGLLNDHFHIVNTINEKRLTHTCRIVESISGIRIPENKPLIGDSVFTQCAGIHADGDSKDQLYYNQLLPERFGRERRYALGKVSGKANIARNLSELGIQLTPEQTKLVTERVIELGDRKENVTTQDLPYIVSDVIKSSEVVQDKVRIVNYNLSMAKGLNPAVTVRINIDGTEYEETSSGSGQYDAFMKVIRGIYKKLGRTFPKLIDYKVSIPPGGRTDALVSTIITWDYNGKELRTQGLDDDQIEAAIKATVKMLNMIETINNEII